MRTPIAKSPVVRRPVGGGRRRRVLVGAAAAVVGAIVVGIVLTAGSSEPTAAATIDAAVARTSDLMGRSGRAEQHYRFETGGTPAVEDGQRDSNSPGRTSPSRRTPILA